MSPRDVRPTPTSLRRALLLLTPLALLGCALLGLLAQSAVAADPVPAPTSLSGPTGPGDDPSPTWTYVLPPDTVSGPTPVTEPATGTVTISRRYTGECALSRSLPATDFSSGAPCNVVLDGSSSFTGSVVDDGAHYLSVRSVELTETTFTPDDGGPSSTTTTVARSAAVDSAAYVYDGNAPVVTLTGPPGGADRSPQFTVTLSDGTATTVTCAVDGSPTTCSVGPSGLTADLSAAADGPHELTASATDAGGRTTTATATYHLDAVRLLLTGPTAGNDPTPEWTFSGGSFTGATCTLDGVVVPDGCTPSGFTAPALPTPTTGTTHTLQVTVADGLGNTESAATTYLLDTVVQLEVVAPPSPSGDDTPSWTFVAGEPVEVLGCALAPGAGTGSCSVTGFTADPLPATSGTEYVLTVTVRDQHGTVQDVTSAPFVLDTEPASLQLVPGQDAVDDDPTPSWTFAGDTWSAPTCTLTAGGAVVAGGSCTAGGYTAPDLGASTGTDYVLEVRVTDSAGNVATATATYRLDTVAELASGAAPASPGSDRTPTWSFTAEPGSTVTCVLSGPGAAGGTCTRSGFTAGELPPTTGADYVLTVTVTDAVGNSTSRTLPTYRLDTVAELAAGAAPASPGSDRTPTWTFTSEPGSTVTCALTGPGAAGGDCTATGFVAAELPGTTGARYALSVTVVDALGNRTTLALPGYDLDTVLELAVDGPSGPSPDRTPAWTFTGEPLAGLTCTLTGPDGAVLSGGTCDSTGFTAPTLPADGAHVLTVSATDTAGNTATRTATYELDTLHLTVRGPTGPSADRTPTWTFTDEPYASASCVLTGPAGEVFAGRCTTTSSFTAPELALTPGADYVLTVTVVDAIGNTGTLSSAPYRLDTQLPTAVVTVPPGPSRDVSVNWTVSVDEPLSSAACALRRDGVVVAALTSCPGSTTISLPGDGRYDVVVTVVDLAGNASTTTSDVLVHDATVPSAPLVSPTSVTTNRTTATWTVSAEPGVVTTCRVLRADAVVADWTTCGGTFALPLPADGSYQLEVVSTDAVGPGATTRVTYLLDTVAPAAPRLDGPTGPAQGRAPSWSLATDAGTTLACRLVGTGAVVTDWSACAGTFTADLSGLADGGYVLEARATDAAGNAGPITLTAPYVLDTTAPSAPVVTGPAGPSQTRTPAFAWTGEAGARAECLLSRDGVAVGGWTACTSAHAPTLDRDGTWTLTVRLTDAAGNVSPLTVSGGYVLDTTAPAAPVVSPAKTPGRDLAPTWGAAVESGATLECRFTDVSGAQTGWAPCTLPHVTPLDGRPDGAYVLELRATDAAGNVSAVGSGTYVLDTVAPAAAVVTAPASPGSTRTPVFSFTVEPGATTRCRLTSGATVLSEFAPCAGPTGYDLTGAPDGTYTVTVRVADEAGNPGPAATGTYVLDTTAPAAPVLSLSPASPSPDRSVTWAFTYEARATLVCRLAFPTGAVREISTCTSPLVVDLTGLPDGTYTLTVRAVDAAGNVSAALTDVHVIDGAAPVPPRVTGPVTPGSTRTPRWSISAGTTECRLTRGATVLVDWRTCTGGFTADLYGQPDGTYTLAVRARTATGAVSAATLSRYVLDTTRPAAATVVAPPTPSTNRLPTWSIASPEPGATAQCQLLFFGSALTPWQPCAVTPGGALHPVDLTDGADGVYTLVVRIADAAGNPALADARSDYTLDTSAPVGVGVVLDQETPGNDRTPTWRLTTATGAALECQLSSATGVLSDWESCGGTYTADLTGRPDGDYTLQVRAVSAAGTPGPESSSRYTLSTAAPTRPTALALSGTRATDNDRTPTWTFVLPPGTTGWCTVTLQQRPVFAGACRSPFTLDLSSGAPGGYVLTVQALDAVGNLSPGVSSTYTLDTEPPPPPVLTLQPAATGSTLDVQWRFTSGYGTTTECRLLSEGRAPEWQACAGTYETSLSLRPDGEYVLEVRAVDAAGNSSAPVRSSYLLDRAGVPVATFTSTPRTPDQERLARWAFTTPDGTGAECRLSGPTGTGAWQPCPTGSYALGLAGLPDGTYLLEVRVVDAEGRRGSASRSSYRLDTEVPAALGFSPAPPLVGNDPDPRWFWEAGDDEVQCRLLRNGVEVAAWQACTSPYEADLSRLGQATYVLELRVVDAAGNVSPVRGAAYTYDTRPPPLPTFLSQPRASGADRTVSWVFDVPPGHTATCTVTRNGAIGVRPEAPCAGRYDLNLTGLPDGDYTLAVRFTDAAGNVGPARTGSYRLSTLRVGGPGRVDGPSAPGGSGGGPGPGTGPGRLGTAPGPIGPRPSTSGPGVPTLFDDSDVQRSSLPRAGRTPVPGARPGSQAEPEEEVAQGRGNRSDAGISPDQIRGVVVGTIARPTLPLALLVIVVLFLLAQNRIDRRDPKLASAPMEAEPELDFTVFIRRPGGAHA